MFLFFFFNDTATTEIYTLSLHDALPIWPQGRAGVPGPRDRRAEELLGEDRRGDRRGDPRTHRRGLPARGDHHAQPPRRSEEHTSELQSRQYLVCRLLLEKKKNIRLPHQL